VPNTYTSFSLTSGANTNEFTIPFAFLNEVDVKIRSTIVSPNESVIPNNRILNWTYTPYSNFSQTFVNGETNLAFGNYSIVFENGLYKARFSKAIYINGISVTYNILIYRETAILNSYFFRDGSAIQARDLNNITLQNSYVLEEIKEYNQLLDAFNLSSLLQGKLDKTGGSVTGNITTTGSIILSNASQGLTTPSVALNGGTISNLPTPANSTDAVNKGYVDGLTIAGSPLVITDNSVTDSHLRKVADQQAVTTATIRNSAVTAEKLATDSVINSKLQTDSISSRCIQAGSVTNSKLAVDSVASTNLIASSVTEGKIQNNAVTSSKLGLASVTNAILADNSVSATKLQDNSVVASKIAVASIASNKLLNSPFQWTSDSVPTIANSATTLTIQPTTINATNSVLNVKEINQNPVLTSANYIPFFNGTRSTPIFNQFDKLNGILPLSQEVQTIKTDGDFNYNSSLQKLWMTQTPYCKVVAIPETPQYAIGTMVNTFPFKLGIKNPYCNGEVGCVSMFAYRPVTQTRGGHSVTSFPYVNNQITQRTITTLPLNAVIFNNNPNITLDTATGIIGLVNRNNNAVFEYNRTFLIVITGTISTTGSSNGHFFMRYPSQAFQTSPTTSNTPHQSSVGYLWTPNSQTGTYLRSSFDFRSTFSTKEAITSFNIQYYFDHPTGLFNGGYNTKVLFGDTMATWGHLNLPAEWRNFIPAETQTYSIWNNYAVCVTLIEVSNVDLYNNI
jgi:hypothetical protein